MNEDKNTIEALDIPNINDKILEAASKGELVIFIGAGVSQIIGCPSWQEFAQKYLDFVYKEKSLINYYAFKKLKEFEPRKLLSICKTILQENKEELPPSNNFLEARDPLVKKYQIYENLYSMNVIFVTTNYDQHLDNAAKNPVSIIESEGDSSTASQAVQSTVEELKIYYLDDDFLVSNLTVGTIIHLHGSANDDESLVMTIQDYMKLYEKDTRAYTLLKEIFDRYTVLFIGYGLEEFEILEFMVNSASSHEENQIKHFMLYPVFKEETSILEFHQKYYETLGITLIPYPIGENGYEQLASIIEQWAPIININSRPKSFIEMSRLIDEVVS